MTTAIESTTIDNTTLDTTAQAQATEVKKPGHSAEAEAIKLAHSIDNAYRAFERAVRILQQSCDNLEALGAGEEGDIIKDVRAVNNALFFTLSQQEKAREAGIERFGTGGAGELDLDCARAEIGLRLACLRDRG